MIRLCIKLILITALIFLGTGLWYGQLKKKILIVDDGKTKIQPSEQIVLTKEILQETKNYQIIISRNIFQAAIDDRQKVSDKQTVVPVKLAQTSLDLTLDGTVSGAENDARAIITDKKKRHQDMYRIGDTIQGAEVKSIKRGQVILSVNGQNEVLALEERKGGKNSVSRKETVKRPTVVSRKPDYARQKRKINIVRPKRPRRVVKAVPRKFQRIQPKMPSPLEEEIETDVDVAGDTNNDSENGEDNQEFLENDGSPNE